MHWNGTAFTFSLLFFSLWIYFYQDVEGGFRQGLLNVYILKVSEAELGKQQNECQRFCGRVGSQHLCVLLNLSSFMSLFFGFTIYVDLSTWVLGRVTLSTLFQWKDSRIKTYCHHFLTKFYKIIIIIYLSKFYNII